MFTNDPVTVREERVTIPTYRVGAPEKNPMFLEKRVYQGSSGVVYPYPIIERVSDEKQDQEWTAIWLENRYLKIMLLPELGGRVQMALDKTNGHHFVYYNQVIKPALVGLTGPWLSGGIEFNWPQHHRPTTYAPVDFTTEANADGSKTVWFSEIERMFRTKGMAGFTLHPDRAYLEIAVQLSNRTDQPQTFLWWANPAVHVNDDYQSVFPPDVRAVMDHGKRDVSEFPIARGVYYKMDYAPGTDISRYKNIPVPTSYMAYHSDFDFLGCYDHGKQAGMMHVANHHTVPGKKQWTWGNGDFGRAWDRQLTDVDGPYIELMCGAYTDNQPDFSWLMPGEEKQFTQVFMPYKGIGAAKNASKDAVINLEIADGTAQIGVYVSSPRHVNVQLVMNGEPFFSREIDLDPTAAFLEIVALPANVAPQALTLRVREGERTLIEFTPLPDVEPTIPKPATAAKPPQEIASNEELYLNGLHLEQYRHATYSPKPYYEEALRRDPHDSRCNNAMGRLLYRSGSFMHAERHFRIAVESLTRRNPNPYDGEPFYNLGLALRMQRRYTEAFDAFYKATWNAAWQDSAYFELARLACRDARYAEALELIDRSLSRNQRHHQARHLRIALLRHLNQNVEARKELTRAVTLDRFNFGALYEQFLLDGDTTYRDRMRGAANTYIEISLDYAHAGLFREAIALLSEAPTPDPLTLYFLGWFHSQAGDEAAAKFAFEGARTLPPDYCFPNQIECVPALQYAQYATLPKPVDARASYLLGNFFYAHRRYSRAIQLWELSRECEPAYPTVHRNLGLAYMNKWDDPDGARESYETAFRLDESDARVFFELDQLRKRLNQPPPERLASLVKYAALVEQRDDLMLEWIALLNLLGRHDEALRLLLARNFHPWEGGEGKTTGQYVVSLVEVAKRCLAAGDPLAAIDQLEQARHYPSSLGEGKLPGARENHIDYYLGLAYQQLGDADQAQHHLHAASRGSLEPSSPLYYNDQPPEMLFYQGKALEALGDYAQAQSIFEKLVAYGETHLHDDVQMDYFAVSLPDFLVFDEDLNRRNRLHCEFMMALGCLGLNRTNAAREHFDAVLSTSAYHLGAVLHRAPHSATASE